MQKLIKDGDSGQMKQTHSGYRSLKCAHNAHSSHVKTDNRGNTLEMLIAGQSVTSISRMQAIEFELSYDTVILVLLDLN